MSPVAVLDQFQMREVEMQLTAELHTAHAHQRCLDVRIQGLESNGANPDRLSRTEIQVEHLEARLAYHVALQHFVDFAINRVVPRDLARPDSAIELLVALALAPNWELGRNKSARQRGLDDETDQFPATTSLGRSHRVSS